MITLISSGGASAVKYGGAFGGISGRLAVGTGLVGSTCGSLDGSLGAVMPSSTEGNRARRSGCPHCSLNARR